MKSNNTLSVERRKTPEKWELDLIYLMNRLMLEYGKLMAKKDKVYRGKYPSPLDKAMNDILDLVAQALHQNNSDLKEKIERMSQGMSANSARRQVCDEISKLLD